MSLDKYNEKRNFKKTREPKGKKENPHKRLKFCVQHHLASHDHYDFRLELDGVLKSFAVPKGPSYNPKDKRLAVMVEDHPLSYRNFEGIIPEGEYGGGTVMLWDRGYYKIDYYDENVLKITLYGKRLKGSWSLVNFKDNNFLLIKENDKYANYAKINTFKTSIKSNLTMQEIKKKYLNK